MYRLRTGPHTQTGIAGCSSLDEYDSDVIRKHERTRKDKEDDRTRHMMTLAAQTGPVFMTYRDLGALDALVSQASREAPLFDFSAPDGVAHTIWRLSPEATERADEALSSRAALLHRRRPPPRGERQPARATQLREANPDHTGAEDYNFFLTVRLPGRAAQDPAVQPGRQRPGRPVARGVPRGAREPFALREGSQAAPTRKGDINVYVDGQLVRPRPCQSLRAEAPIEALDADLLQATILDPLLGIKDIRTDKRIDFVGGIRGTEELEQLVSDGKAAIAFSLHPVSLDELMAISDANEIMPPKSTWFEPKLRDGLLITSMI